MISIIPVDMINEGHFCSCFKLITLIIVIHNLSNVPQKRRFSALYIKLLLLFYYYKPALKLYILYNTCIPSRT